MVEEAEVGLDLAAEVVEVQHPAAAEIQVGGTAVPMI
jgi:hypothetical protein